VKWGSKKKNEQRMSTPPDVFFGVGLG